MSRTVRAVMVVAAVVALAALGSEALSRSAPRGPRREPPRPGLAVGTDVDVAVARGTPLAALRGRYIVAAPALTHCHELCPITTGVLLELQRRLAEAGLTHRVAVVEVTVDPWRDTPAVARAFERRTGGGLRFLTGSVSSIRRLWRRLGVGFRRVRGDVEHTGGVFIVGPDGRERVAVVGMAAMHGALPARLASQLSPTGRMNLRHPQAPWTAQAVLQDLWHVMGSAPLTASAPHTTLLRAGPAAVQRRLAALRGHPVVVNAWASWCPPCRIEAPLLAQAARRFGHQVAFVGLDVNDSVVAAQRFLGRHPFGYPSFSDPGAKAALTLGRFAALPTTFFLDAAGNVVYVHLGEYHDEAALAADIARIAPR